eukprot:363974-Chlamydomonas_euryale.AAC.8
MPSWEPVLRLPCWRHSVRRTQHPHNRTGCRTAHGNTCKQTRRACPQNDVAADDTDEGGQMAGRRTQPAMERKAGRPQDGTPSPRHHGRQASPRTAPPPHDTTAGK